MAHDLPLELNPTSSVSTPRDDFDPYWACNGVPGVGIACLAGSDETGYDFDVLWISYSQDRTDVQYLGALRRIGDRSGRIENCRRHVFQQGPHQTADRAEQPGDAPVHLEPWSRSDQLGWNLAGAPCGRDDADCGTARAPARASPHVDGIGAPNAHLGEHAFLPR